MFDKNKHNSDPATRNSQSKSGIGAWIGQKVTEAMTYQGREAAMREVADKIATERDHAAARSSETWMKRMGMTEPAQVGDIPPSAEVVQHEANVAQMQIDLRDKQGPSGPVEGK